MMKLYDTNPAFNKDLYIECLAKMGVKAYKTEDGVMIDIEAYKANYSLLRAPHMVIINHPWIKALY